MPLDDPNASKEPSPPARVTGINPMVQIDDRRLLAVAIACGLLIGGATIPWLNMLDGSELPGPLQLAHLLLAHCGVWLAAPMVFLVITGTVFGLEIWIRVIPSRGAIARQWESINKSIGDLVPRSDLPVATSRLAGPIRAMSAEQAVRDAAATTSGFDAAGAAATATTPAPGPRVSPPPVAKPSPDANATAAVATWNRFIHSCSAAHPWLGLRMLSVAEALSKDGPDAALSHNDDIGSQQEAAVAGALLPVQVCEWALPLLGFLGTVWGLHEAIPPLKRGIETFMEAMQANGGGADLRKQGISRFGEGFDGLMLAFDSTLVGLIGVLITGGLVFLLRRRALAALGDIHVLIQQSLSRLPARGDGLRDIVQRLETQVAQSLFAESEQQIVPVLPIIADSVQRGLVLRPSENEQPKSQIDEAARLLLAQSDRQSEVLRKAIEVSLRDLQQQLKRDTTSIVRALAAQIQEARFQSRLQFRAIAPDLRHLRQMVARMRSMMTDPPGSSDEGSDDIPYILEPFMRPVLSLPEELQIDALTLSRDAAFACVAATDPVQSLHLVQEVAIPWGNDSGKMDGHIRATEQQRTSGQSMLGVTYAPAGHRLLVARQGLVRVFQSSEEGSFHQERECIITGQMTSSPFVWLGDSSGNPLVSRWHEGTFSFATLEDRSVGLPGNLQYALTALGTDGDHGVRHRHHRDIVVILRGGRLIVARLVPGGGLELVAASTVSDAITAADISADGQFVVYALRDGSINIWRFDQSGDDAHQRIATGGRADSPALVIDDLHINGAGDAIAVLCRHRIALLDLRHSTRPRIFDAGDARVTCIVSSPERGYLLASTTNNQLLLFSFGVRV